MPQEPETRFPHATKVITKAEKNYRRQRHYLLTGERPAARRVGLTPRGTVLS